VAFDVRPRAAERRAPAAWIQNLVDAVSRSDFEASLTRLASFPTRFSTSAQYRDAATWARGQLEAMGYSTTVQPISIPVLGDNSQNVLAERLGTGSGMRDLVLVVAHLDSFNMITHLLTRNYSPLLPAARRKNPNPISTYRMSKPPKSPSKKLSKKPPSASPHSERSSASKGSERYTPS
jgi:hypothetical protein